MDRSTQLLVEALRNGRLEPQGHRLYGKGKQPGLFADKSAETEAIAAQAIRDGLMVVARTETKGKTITEWASITERGIDFLLEQESPRVALDELRTLLQSNANGIPAWLEQIRAKQDDLNRRLIEQVEMLSHRFNLLSERLLEGATRVTQLAQAQPATADLNLTWSESVLLWLNKRRQTGRDEASPLPELFVAARSVEPELTIKEFHVGIRRLHDRGVIRLLECDAKQGPAEPEYALLDGATTYYYAAR